jgi:hypothetical protein
MTDWIGGTDDEVDGGTNLSSSLGSWLVYGL